MPRKREKVVLAIDFGGWGTKFIGGPSFDERYAGVIGPQVIEIPKELLEAGWFSDELCDRAWIEINDKTYALGALATSLAKTHPMLSRPKVETGVRKVLAALWIVKEKFQLSDRLKISLCCLLPPGERKDEKKLWKELKELETGFTTPTGRITFELEEFCCKAEGSGIYLHHRYKRSPDALRRRKIAVLMLGYRDVSTMIFTHNNLTDSYSCSLGFAELVKKIIRQSSSQNLDRLTPAIANYLETPTDKDLTDVLPNKDSSTLEEFKRAIEISKKQYKIELENWFQEVFPQDLREVVAGGGTADTLRTDLCRLLVKYDLYFHADVKLPDDIKLLEMGNRFGDLWCIWDYFFFLLSQKNTKKQA
jgi:hypothetical protein